MSRADLAEASQSNNRTSDSRSTWNFRGTRHLWRTLSWRRSCCRTYRQQRCCARTRSGMGWGIHCTSSLVRHRQVSYERECRRPSYRRRDGCVVDSCLSNQVRLRSVTTPPATRTMSAGAAPKLSFHVPAAAHTSSYCNKSGSTNTRS